MNLTVRIAAFAFAFAIAAPAAAQAPRAGIGIGLSAPQISSFFSSSGLEAAQLYFPLNVSPGLRIEPQVGLLTIEDDAFGTESSTFTLGVGVLFTKQVAPQVLAYVGPRLSISFVSETDFGPPVIDADGTDFRLAGAIGGEYQFSPRFSIGAEGQLGYLAIGDKDVAGGGQIPGGSSWQTTAIVFFRIFLL